MSNSETLNILYNWYGNDEAGEQAIKMAITALEGGIPIGKITLDEAVQELSSWLGAEDEEYDQVIHIAVDALEKAEEEENIYRKIGGLTMTDVEKTIQALKNQERIHIDYAKDKDLTGVCLIGKSAELAIQALEREQQYIERNNPTPLTYEQLKQRAGKPVFVVYNNNYDGSLWGIVTLAGNTVVIRCPSRDILPRENENRMKFFDYEPKEDK